MAVNNPAERLGFGCVSLTTFPTATRAVALLEGVFELGLRHFDTAPIYGQGYSEQLLGAFLRTRRDKVTIATKFGLSPGRSPSAPAWLALPLNAARRSVAADQPRMASPGAPAMPGQVKRPTISREAIAASLDRSRRALRTDYIDLFLLHEGTPSGLEPDAFDYLQELKASQIIGRIGLAANGASYLPLTPADVIGWDVLQYESGPAWPANGGLQLQFPEQQHIFHSCLKAVDEKGLDGAGAAGRVLAERLNANPTGAVLFSSRNLDHVRANLDAAKRSMCLS